jgi:hypothetical protein
MSEISGVDFTHALEYSLALYTEAGESTI